MSDRLVHDLDRVQRAAWGTCFVGFVLLTVGWFVDPVQLHRSWLLGYLFWLAPALGSLAIVMLHQMTGGAWGFSIRRLLEAAMRTLPWMALLFLPIALGMHELYEWSHADAVAADPILQRKAAYLNTPFFLVRAAVFFAAWIGLSRLLLRSFERYDRTFQPAALRRSKVVSGVGLPLYVLTMSFASFDWTMSLEPHWFSTIYGVHYVVGQALGTLCFAVVVATLLARYEPFSRWIEKSHFHDLGNLMLAFVLLWAYVSFSQYLIIWSGNLPEETPFYLARTNHGWQVIALVLVVAHFATPFFVLLMRRNKRESGRLAKLAAALFVLRYADYYWLVAPSFHESLSVSWMDLAALVAIGGLWVALFVQGLRGRPLVSLQDAKLLGRLEEAPTS